MVTIRLVEMIGGITIKRTLLLSIVSLFLFLALLSPALAHSIGEDVISFANKEGLTLIKEGLSKDPEGYGYSNETEISEITVGEGMQINFIDTEKLKTASDSLLDTVTPQENWVFLILSNGIPRSKMVIQRDQSGAFQVTEFGGNPDTLAYAIDSLKAEGEVSDPTLIRERDEYIAAFKKEDQELIIPPLQPASAESKGLSSTTEPQEPERIINVLKTMQNDSSDDEKDGSGTIASAYYSENNNHLKRYITISTIIAILFVTIIWVYLRSRKPSK